MDRDAFVNFHDRGAIQLIVEEFHGFRLKERRDEISPLKKKGECVNVKQTRLRGAR